MTILQLLWFGLGLVTGAIYLWSVKSSDPQREQAALGMGLLIAALVYVGFAGLWGDGTWLLVEFAGVALYGIFG